MWCRVLLVAIALTCTFQKDIIADGQSTPRIDQIKDIICVLVLSGLQKNDLDANLLRKLQRHNVNIDDMNNEALEKCLQSFTSVKSNENNSSTDEISLTTSKTLGNKDITDFIETEKSTDKNYSQVNNDISEDSKNKLTILKNVWAMFNKTKQNGEEGNAETTTNEVALAFSKKFNTFNDVSKIDSQAEYFNINNETFQKYRRVTGPQTTTPISKHDQDQNITETEISKNLITPQNLTFENFIHLWKLFDTIKSQDDSVNIKIEHISKNRPIPNNQANQNDGSQTKGTHYTNLMFQSYVAGQQAQTTNLKSIQQFTNTISPQIKKLPKINNNYLNNSMINDLLESTYNGNENWYKPHNIDDKVSPARIHDTTKHINQSRRQQSVNESRILEISDQGEHNTKTVITDTNIVQQETVETTKGGVNVLPDHIIRQITEKLKVSLLKHIQNQMSSTTIKITTIDNAKVTTTHTTPIIVHDENKTMNYESFIELLHKFRNVRDRDYTTEMSSTSLPISIQENVQNETSVYKKIMALLFKEVNQKPTEMTTTNTPTTVQSIYRNDTTVIKSFMELFQKFKRENLDPSTTETPSTTQFILTHHDMVKAANSLDDLIEIFEEYKNRKDNAMTPADPKYTLTQKKNTKNEFHGPINVLYPSLLPINYAHDVKKQSFTVIPMFMNHYPQAYPLHTAQIQPYYSNQYEMNQKTPLSMISGFHVNPVNNIVSVIEDMPKILLAPVLQTNADTIPPLGIPISKTVKALNQNIVVTTKHPMEQFREQHSKSETNGDKYQEYTLRDYERYDTDLARSDADIERSRGVELERSHRLGHKYTQRARSVPSQIKRIDKENTKHRQASDFDNFYRDYINSIKPHENKGHLLPSNDRKRVRFHEKLETADDRPRHYSHHTYIPNDKTRLKVAPRHQVSFDHLKKRGRNDDYHFRNFIKTQQKVNDMLEKILAANITDKIRSVETPETIVN